MIDIDKKTKYGSINISLDAIASVAGDAAIECYGVVGLAEKNFRHDILKKENYAKGVYVHKVGKGQIAVDIYIVVVYGIRITEIIFNVQKKIKFDLEKTFNMEFAAINIYVQGVEEL